MANLERLSKQIVKNIIEDLRRFLNKKNIFCFNFGNKKIKFYLPHRRDNLQQQIIVKKNFYEIYPLKKVSKYIPNNPLILDVGSNIGNHAIFFGKILNAKHIYCFEPQKEIFEILKKNILLNNLEQKATLYNLALGSESHKGKIKSEDKNNSGGASISKEEGEEIEIKKIDSFRIKEKIDFIKIDVEGFELEVLKGGDEKIKEDRPIIWVEVGKRNEEKISNYFQKRNYKKIDKKELKNWLFVPKEKFK